MRRTEILLGESGGQYRGAVLTDGVLTDYRATRPGAPSLVGGIYRARIRKVVPGLAAAAAEIPAGEIWIDLGPGRRGALREGGTAVVQVVQDAQGGKRARAGIDLGIAGRFLVFRPGAAKPALSHRIADNNVRARLGALLPRLGGEEGHVLALHGAGAADDAMLAREAEALRAAWQRVREAGARGIAPAELLAPADAALDLLRVFVGPAVARIAVDSEGLAATVRAWLEAKAPEWRGVVEREPFGRTTLESAAVRDTLEEALAREVVLPGGGSVVVEAAAGLTSIDVDTDRAAGLSARASFAQVNREAADAIARQIRLRNLGGRIVVDFAGLGAGRDLPAVLQRLRAGVAEDPMAVRIAPPSEFGLVEMLRRRERPPLAETLAAS